ncbi:hypothetical protein CDD81_4547 [Ophiocordyceps australis]|uniref:Zn(2)-C6 fungal-type domain-containing protein n=1 Tax=Ophiocordyceps australis TaxID=1399860 RepID=A0A2C5YB34_9HYPO|nr:hypothetical protein CDD81_4547 [Ophiocordyceps australis]
MDPQGGAWGTMVLPSPSPSEPTWNLNSSQAPTQTDQLSPISSALDLPMDPAPSSMALLSATSSCADSWALDDADQERQWDCWDASLDGSFVVPKLEPVDDDDVLLEQVEMAPSSAPPALASSASCKTKQKRPRGRPRKNNLGSCLVPFSAKVTKGRSKTGCITCRKRKKKCDEAKPRCMNCEKNAVVCEGYHEKQIWKSGRERAEEERLKRETVPVATLPPLINGVETVEDMIFWKHFATSLSNVLTVEGEMGNVFKSIVLPLATKHQGLMHSVLTLSGRHLDYDSPYGAKVLTSNPKTTRSSLDQRADYHHHEAIKWLQDSIESPTDKHDPGYQTMLAAQYSQILCHLIQTRVDGNTRGEHRIHLRTYQEMMRQCPPPVNTMFYAFITEMFQYHIFTDDLFWHPDSRTNRLTSQYWRSDVPLDQPRMIGVDDDLFRLLCHISSMRDKIRAKLARPYDLLIQYEEIYEGIDIDTAIRDWMPSWPPGDCRHKVMPVYQQTMWIYLYRTLYPPDELLWDGPKHSAYSTSPQRRASMAATTGYGPATDSTSLDESTSSFSRSCSKTYDASRANSMHELPTSLEPASPLEGRRSSSLQPCSQRLRIAVEQSLSMLESFKPSDPAQTLLLIPCLINGTACFEVPQRDRIRAAVRTVRGYTGLRSCDRVLQLLEKIWSLMDQGDEFSVWDWQGLAKRTGLDFGCA